MRTLDPDRAAAWDLYGELWQLSQHMQPGLSMEDRRLLLDSLLRPVTEPEAPGTVKAMIIGRLYQLLLLIHLRHEAL